MPNPYFRFKQFTVYHDLCAMKVGTDGVLLGAWATISNMSTVLDIGTGTGLLALMLAQRNPGILIKAIDIDRDAAKQAEYNVTESPFRERIECECISLHDFAAVNTGYYDLIVSNPPFFDRSLKSPDAQRTLARHTDTLPMEEVIRLSAGLLSEHGKLAVIYPYEYKEQLRTYANTYGLHMSRLTYVYPTPASPAKRILAELSKEEVSLAEDELTIETDRHIYSEEFRELAKSFYLKM